MLLATVKAIIAGNDSGENGSAYAGDDNGCSCLLLATHQQLMVLARLYQFRETCSSVSQFFMHSCIERC
jgi:hypothetical protein